MKRDWELQELIEEWTLVPRELELLGNKTGSTRLGYSVLLKFFQREGRFPESRGDIAKAVLRYLSRQVNVEPEEFRYYDWQSRSATYHRRQIREFCGFRSPTIQDADDLKDWLLSAILPQSQDLPFVEQAANQRLRELGIEGLRAKHLGVWQRS
jgi:transglutaminase-like putative cysteine protease